MHAQFVHVPTFRRSCAIITRMRTQTVTVTVTHIHVHRSWKALSSQHSCKDARKRDSMPDYAHTPAPAQTHVQQEPQAKHMPAHACSQALVQQRRIQRCAIPPTHPSLPPRLHTHMPACMHRSARPCACCICICARNRGANHAIHMPTPACGHAPTHSRPLLTCTPAHTPHPRAPLVNHSLSHPHAWCTSAICICAVRHHPRRHTLPLTGIEAT